MFNRLPYKLYFHHAKSLAVWVPKLKFPLPLKSVDENNSSAFFSAIKFVIESHQSPLTVM